VQAALGALETGGGDAARFEELFREFRAMSEQTVRSRLTLGLPDAGLERGQAIGLNVIKRDIGTGEATGGVGLFVTGEPG
jgi:hypothetical protein